MYYPFQDLPQLIEGRIDYFEPSFEAVIRSGVSHAASGHAQSCVFICVFAAIWSGYTSEESPQKTLCSQVYFALNS